MNKLLKTMVAASFTLSTYSAFAADQTNNATNTEDAKEGLVQDETMNQSTEQSTATSTKKDRTGKKNMSNKNRKGSNTTDYKMMDTNSDGMISKDEYIKHHDQSFSKMKQTNGNVSMQDMEDHMNLGTTKGNKLQPNSTKGAPPEAKTSSNNN